MTIIEGLYERDNSEAEKALQSVQYIKKIQTIVTFRPCTSIVTKKSSKKTMSVSRYCTKEDVHDGIQYMIEEFFGKVFEIIDSLYMHDRNIIRVILKPKMGEKAPFFARCVYGSKNINSDPFIVLRDYFEDRAEIQWDNIIYRNKSIRVEVSGMELISVEMETYNRREIWKDLEDGVFVTNVEFEMIDKIEIT